MRGLGRVALRVAGSHYRERFWSASALPPESHDLEGRPRKTPWPPKNDPLIRHIDPDSFVRLWRSDLGQMIEQAREAGAEVILMTYPNYQTPATRCSQTTSCRSS